MFQALNAARSRIAPLAVATVSFAHRAPFSDSNERCDPTVCHCESNNSTAAPAPANQDPYRVLVVGSGLTGCLTALRIRQRANDRGKPVDITMVERATYPAGRFAATATYQGCIADIGAQVLSTINPLDHRALGGHGVEVKDIKLADDLVRKLISHRTIAQARDEALGETEERMLWEGLWIHYFAPAGLVSVMQKLLDWADVQPLFSVRIDSIDTESSDASVSVKGVVRRFTEDEADASTAYSESYDCVVLCIPAPDVLDVQGALQNLSEASRHVLHNVGYDQRVCEAHFFSGEMKEDLTKAFEDGNGVEIMVEDVDDEIQYISWQNRKSSDRACHDNNSVIVLVAHGQTGHLDTLGNSLDRTLSKLTGKTEDEIASCRLYSKSIPWHTSQMITPMEAVVSDPPSPAWQCIAGKDRRLIIAGDFMTQSSFVGCVASADAAARAVIEGSSVGHGKSKERYVATSS